MQASRLRRPRVLRPSLLFPLFALLAAAPVHVRANTLLQTASGDSATLGEVQVTGSKRFASEEIAPSAGLRIGSAVSRQDLQAGADRLAKLGLFATVQYKFSSGPRGVIVEYQVTDGPTVPVEFDNFIWMSDAELADGLKKAGVLYDGTAPLQGAALDAISAGLEKLLDARGVHQQVSHEAAQSASTGERVILFRVEGADLLVKSVEFGDDLAKNDPNIQQRLADIIGKPYSRSRMILFENEQVRPVYLAHAFLGVKFGPPTARFASSPSQPVPDSVIALIAIDRGPASTWSGVTWIGNHSILSQQLDALVDFKPGEPADGNRLEALWQRVQQIYANAGFIDETQVARPQFDPHTGRVTFQVTIQEGPQYHMGNLVLTGLSIEGERRIRAAWKIPTGVVFDDGVYQDFLTQGIRQAFAGYPAHYEKIGRFLDRDAEHAIVNVMIDFQ
ncbi:MAG: POTRA domain-containing protein [Candidatus Acidiferrales bacterium]